MSKITSPILMICLAFGLLSCNEIYNDQDRQQSERPASPTTTPPSQEDEFKMHRITSKALGYKLQYWVQLPEGYDEGKDYPTLYVTDGNGYIKKNRLPKTAGELMEERKISPVIIVYVDARDPDNPERNRRNSQFLCNPKYVHFYREELVPEVDRLYRTNREPSARGILGLSFGGLNAMYFGIYANDVFGKLGIQSPAPHPCPEILDAYNSHPVLPVDIFLSTGTVNDKARITRKFKGILEEKGYEFAYEEVAEGHNWDNWGPLLDDVLLYFYGR